MEEEWRLQHVKYCEHCKVYKFPNPVYYDMNRPCPDCGSTWIDTDVPYCDYSIIGRATNEDEKTKMSMIELKKNDPIQYELVMNTFRQKVIEQEKNDNMVKCPRCGSSNIQLVAKRWSILTGFFTSKVNRFCVNCKTKF